MTDDELIPIEAFIRAVKEAQLAGLRRKVWDIPPRRDRSFKGKKRRSEIQRPREASPA